MATRTTLMAVAVSALCSYAACGGRAIIDPPLDGAGGASSSTVATTNSNGTASQGTTGSVTVSTVSTNQSASTAAQVTATSTSSGSPGSCDIGDCGECINSDCTYKVCQSAFDGCFNNSDCMSFIDCVSSCQTEQCFDTCQGQFPAGAELYFGIIECAYCTPAACYKDCDGALVCDP